MAVQTDAATRRDGLAFVWDIGSKLLLVTVFVVFAIAHFSKWRSTGEPTGLGLVMQEGLVAALFLLRRPPRRSSRALTDWLLAVTGSFLILAVRPTGSPLFGLRNVYLVIQLAGLVGVVASLGVLGRSFGIVAADRGLKTGGPYAIVRHPTYLSYLITQSGYLLQNPSFWNLALVLVTMACQIGRIRAEERVLGQDEAWRRYARRVRFRLIPGVF